MLPIKLNEREFTTGSQEPTIEHSTSSDGPRPSVPKSAPVNVPNQESEKS